MTGTYRLASLSNLVWPPIQPCSPRAQGWLMRALLLSRGSGG